MYKQVCSVRYLALNTFSSKAKVELMVTLRKHFSEVADVKSHSLISACPYLTQAKSIDLQSHWSAVELRTEPCHDCFNILIVGWVLPANQLPVGLQPLSQVSLTQSNGTGRHHFTSLQCSCSSILPFTAEATHSDWNTDSFLPSLFIVGSPCLKNGHFPSLNDAWYFLISANRHFYQWL